MSELNGKRDDEDWVIAIVGGRTMVGRLAPALTLGGVPVDSRLVLSPVYDLQAGLVQTQQGPMVVHQAFPVLMMQSISSLEVPAGCATIALSVLAPQERRIIMNAVGEAEKFAQALRAAQGGIALAKSMPKIKGA